MNGICLFAGSGISELALKAVIPNYRTVCYVENDGYCVAQIASRIKDGRLDDAPIWDDVRTFDGKAWRGRVDIVTGGFPCQPFSVAGKNKGAEDERNCWPDTQRIISEVRPRYALLENVPNLLAHEYIRQIFGKLSEIGYDCEWTTVGARDVGANCHRVRIFILAVAKSFGLFSLRPSDNGEEGAWRSEAIRRQDWHSVRVGSTSLTVRREWDNPPEPDGMVNGVAERVDRLKAIGNGWVPQVVANILKHSIHCDERLT